MSSDRSDVMLTLGPDAASPWEIISPGARSDGGAGRAAVLDAPRPLESSVVCVLLVACTDTGAESARSCAVVPRGGPGGACAGPGAIKAMGAIRAMFARAAGTRAGATVDEGARGAGDVGSTAPGSAAVPMRWLAAGGAGTIVGAAVAFACGGETGSGCFVIGVAIGVVAVARLAGTAVGIVLTMVGSAVAIGAVAVAAPCPPSSPSFSSLLARTALDAGVCVAVGDAGRVVDAVVGVASLPAEESPAGLVAVPLPDDPSEATRTGPEGAKGAPFVGASITGATVATTFVAVAG
jgi:hypothetical protein